MTSAGTQLLGEVAFSASSLDQLPIDELRAALVERHVIKVSGLFTEDEILRAREIIERGFRRDRDRSHDPKDSDAIKQNFQKLQVGGVASKNVFRVLRTMFNPIWAPDDYGMRELFVRLARFRNRLCGFREGFAIHGIEDGLWTAARIHQYPAGGGCMAAHRDYLPAHASEDLGSYAQVYLPMSRKGVDFHKGGAFLVAGGELVEYEDACRLGDVLVYDGRIEHGVADVDPFQLLELDRFTGRVAAFVTLYRDLASGGDAYERFQNAATAR